MITTRKKRLDVNYTPLQCSGDIETVGSVPDRQIYSADTKEYTPDYTLTPLVLFPRCNATDPDQYTKSGVVNASLTNMKWYEIQGTKRTLIDSGNANYEITNEGDTKGQIKIKRNSSVTTPLALEFYAEYVDTRTNQVFPFRMSTVIPVSDATLPSPVMKLDSPSSVIWNPLRNPLSRTIKASVFVGGSDIASDKQKCKFFWYRKLDTGALEAITDGNGDNDWEVDSIDHNTLTINQDYIGDEQTYVCKLAYAADGNLPGSPSDNAPVVSTTIRRRIPDVEADWKGVPSQLPGGTTKFTPEAFVMDGMGIIPNADEWLRFVWNVKSPYSQSYSRQAIGVKPTITFIPGMMLELEVQDRGPQAILIDDTDGTVLQDADGNVLFDRINN